MALFNPPRDARVIAPVGTYLENGKVMVEVIEADDARFVWAENSATGYPLKIEVIDLMQQWRKIRR